MRNLAKLSEPPILTENKESWTQAYMASDGKSSPWRHEDIKRHLTEETLGRCAYCEGAILAVSFGDIEHIKPRSVFPRLVVAWDNLTLACSRCNGKKSDKWDPQLPFVNPYVDLVSDHIFFVGSMAYSRSERGMYTIRELELNAAARIEAREATIGNLALAFDRLDRATTQYSRQYFRELIDALISDGEYSAASRSFAMLRSTDASNFRFTSP